MWKLIIDRKPITLGEYPIISAAMARAKAMRVLNGEDEQSVQVVTLSQFIDEYYREFAKSHHSRPKETLSHLGSDRVFTANLSGYSCTCLSKRAGID